MTAVDDQDPAPRLEALADQARVDPVGLTVDLVTSIDPGLDPQTVRDVVTGVAAGRAKVRRLAAALAQRPAVLCDGRSPAPLASCWSRCGPPAASRSARRCARDVIVRCAGVWSAGARTGAATRADATGTGAPAAATTER